MFTGSNRPCQPIKGQQVASRSGNVRWQSITPERNTGIVRHDVLARDKEAEGRLSCPKTKTKITASALEAARSGEVHIQAAHVLSAFLFP